jgi:MFS family permease
MSWILNAYTLVFAAFMNPAGRLGDRYGHRRIFLCGLVVFTRGSALCGLSGSFVALVGACRPGPGCGDADAEFARAAAGRRSGRPACRCGQHLVGSGGNGSRTRTPVGGYLVELSWRWIFFVNVPVGLLALIAGLLVLAKTPGTGSGVPDYWVR